MCRYLRGNPQVAAGGVSALTVIVSHRADIYSTKVQMICLSKPHNSQPSATVYQSEASLLHFTQPSSH